MFAAGILMYFYSYLSPPQHADTSGLVNNTSSMLNHTISVCIILQPLVYLTYNATVHYDYDDNCFFSLFVCNVDKVWKEIAKGCLA